MRLRIEQFLVELAEVLYYFGDKLCIAVDWLAKELQALGVWVWTVLQYPKVRLIIVWLIVYILVVFT